MYLQIVPMRVHGRPLDQTKIRTIEPIVGDVLISHQNVTGLNRYADVATVKKNAGESEDALPPLVDCRLAFMGTNGFTLSGVEMVGDIAYGQAWWCRPV